MYLKIDANSPLPPPPPPQKKNKNDILASQIITFDFCISFNITLKKDFMISFKRLYLNKFYLVI